MFWTWMHKCLHCYDFSESWILKCELHFTFNCQALSVWRNLMNIHDSSNDFSRICVFPEQSFARATKQLTSSTRKLALKNWNSFHSQNGITRSACKINKIFQRFALLLFNKKVTFLFRLGNQMLSRICCHELQWNRYGCRWNDCENSFTVC